MKHSGRIGTSIVLLLASVPFACAQTQVDMATQTKDVDFSKAVSTKPAKMGAAVPASCSQGELFFDTTSPAGQNLFGCTATNTWSQLTGGGGGGGAQVASQLSDFSATNTTASVQTIGAGCNGATSCQIRTGGVIFSITSPATATLSGTVSTGTVFWYLSSGQTLTAGYSGPTTITCSAGCAVNTGVTAFPADSIPLWQTTFTANVWDAVNFATMDKRAVYSRDIIAAGPGVVSSSNASTGVQTLSTDPTVVPRYFADSGAPTSTCTAGRDFYTDLTNLHLYFCDAANTWKQADGRTDVENFLLADDTAAAAAPLAAYSSVTAARFTATGPNSISYAVAGFPLSVNDAVMVTKKASPTWSGAAGTVDVSLVASNADGASAGGSWTLNIYAGCAAANDAYSYGSATAISTTPVSLNNFQTYSVSGINYPELCREPAHSVLGAARGGYRRNYRRPSIYDLDGSCDPGELDETPYTLSALRRAASCRVARGDLLCFQYRKRFEPGNPRFTLAIDSGIPESDALRNALNVVANGNYVVGDGTLPYFAGCGTTTTIQSSKWNLFTPAGYRTNPTNDGPNYGKLRMSSGIIPAVESHGAAGGAYETSGGGYHCFITAILGGSTLSYGCDNGNSMNLSNGAQIEFEINNSGTAAQTNIFDGALKVLRKYYVVNCFSCNNSSTGRFQVSAAPTGPAITGLTCTAPLCQLNSGNGQTYVSMPLQVTAGSSTITSPDAPGSGLGFDTIWQNGTPITFTVAAYQVFGTIPAPLEIGAVYYVVGLAGRTFGVAATPGGTPIIISNIGAGPLYASNINVPNNWAFRGLEMTEVAAGNPVYGFIQAGSGAEANAIGMVHHIEIDHCYIHDQINDPNPPARGIGDNGMFVNIHDTYIAGMLLGESQAIQGASSPGPTLITNNFLEAAGEVSLYGGGAPASGTTNANKLFQGNYFYNPPSWKVTTGNIDPVGSCWYDTTDPLHSGGEWYDNTATPQWFQCGNDFVWHTTASTPYHCNGGTQFCGNPLFKDFTEHKSGRYFTYTGNVYNYKWVQAQAGEAWNNSNEAGSGPGWADDHILITNNAVFNVYTGWVRISQCGQNPITLPCPFPPGSHSTVNNLIVTTPLACGVDGGTIGCGEQTIQSVTQFNSGTTVQSDVLLHNTAFVPDTGWYQLPAAFRGGGSNDCVNFPTILNLAAWRNNLWSGDFVGDCVNSGLELLVYFKNSTFSNNAFHASTGNYTNVGTTSSWTSTMYPANNGVIQYVNGDGTSTGDYHLASSSPYSAANNAATLLSSDGTDLGADIDLVNMMTSGARTGVPNWDVQAHLQVDAGSTLTVFRYTAPSAAACAATLYSAPARISTNQVASAADNSGSSISNGGDRQVPVTGLTPSTHYWYKLACGGGAIMVGDYWTKASGSGIYPYTFQWSSATAMRYSTAPGMTGSTNLSAAASQLIPVPTNSTIYAQVGTTGPITVLIAP